jgi:hypothetical protein
MLAFSGIANGGFQLQKNSFNLLHDIAFSHGARDCETFRQSRGESTKDYEQRTPADNDRTITSITEQEITAFFENYSLPDTNDDALFVFGNSQGIVKKNEYQGKFVGYEYCIFFEVNILDSNFMPSLDMPDESVFEHLSERQKRIYGTLDNYIELNRKETKNILDVGFLYTKYYLNGFFFGLLRYLNRDPNAGFYSRESGLVCYYVGHSKENGFKFEICSDKFEDYSKNSDFDHNLFLKSMAPGQKSWMERIV